MNRSNEDLDNKKMPIDQYGRYNTVARIIKQLMQQKKQSKVKILDLGGFKGEIHKFFKKNEVSITILDLYESNDKNYVKGSALNIPFEDKSFDYVVSFEVLEHIPRKDRELFIKEGMRVSQGAFILTAPFSGANNEVFQSEIYVNDLWKNIHQQNHQWLYEHITYKTPKNEEIEKILYSQNLDFKKIGNNDLTLWNMMLSFRSYLTLFKPTGIDSDIQFFYNDNSEVLDSNTDYFYRYIYIIGSDSNSVKIPTKASIPIERKIETVNKLINLIFNKMASEVLHDRRWTQNKFRDAIIDKEHQIKLKTDQANLYLSELNSILSSRSWRYMRKAANMKKVILKKRKQD